MSRPTDAGLVVGPRWLERERPDGDGETDGEPLPWPDREHVAAHRAWTLVGNLGQPGQLDAPRAAVDEAGLVAPTAATWSLDWWIGADDRWHLPSRETAVRQRLIDHAPVVETAMRIPGGDVVQRVFAARASTGADVVVVEIENGTPVPVAVALGVRPYGVGSGGAVERLALTGTTLSVDGRPAVELLRPPNRSAASMRAEGDCAAAVFGGEASTDDAFEVACEAGGAQGAVIYPLPHTAVLRVLLPLGSDGGTPLDSTQLPSAVQVAAGWQRQAAAGARIELPAGRLADAVEANRRVLLLAAGGFGDAEVSILDRGAVVGALDRWGFADDAGVLLAALASRDERGALVPTGDRHDSEGAALVAVADHVRLADDAELLDLLRSPVAHAAGRIRRLAAGSRLRRRAPLGLLPAGSQPSWLGPGRFLRDDLWAVAGLRGAAELLERAGEPAAAIAARADADALWGVVEPALSESASTDDDVHTAVADLVVSQPLDLLPPDHRAVGAIVDQVRTQVDAAGGVPVPRDPTRVSPSLTLALAAVELAAGDLTGLERLDHVVGQASATWSWPEELDRDTGAGVGGAGQHLPTAATFLRLVRDLCVRDDEDELVLLSVFPPTWRGQSVDVHDAPTRFGALSYAIRWHGDRPALLWEIDAHPGVTAATLRAPGLDPGWRGDGLAGDALLAAPVG